MTHFFTIGHSNRNAEDFLALLTLHGIEQLVDVRKIPRSRFNPHFNDKRLAALLGEQGIAYHHMPELGGMRLARADSINKGLREGGGFQGYADYMATDEFAFALNELTQLAEQKRTAYMCAEREPSQCHRSLISDALTLRGHTITHIVRADESYGHEWKDGIVAMGNVPTYPAKTKKQMALL